MNEPVRPATSATWRPPLLGRNYRLLLGDLGQLHLWLHRHQYGARHACPLPEHVVVGDLDGATALVGLALLEVLGQGLPEKPEEDGVFVRPPGTSSSYAPSAASPV
jgi:hypothetical protein